MRLRRKAAHREGACDLHRDEQTETDLDVTRDRVAPHDSPRDAQYRNDHEWRFHQQCWQRSEARCNQEFSNEAQQTRPRR